MPLLPETYDALTHLDDRLVKVLASSAIRLVRSEWLLEQPAGFRMTYRQRLEDLEREGAFPSPLLSAEEAVALVRRGERAAAVLSHGWLSPGDPDPAGARLHIVLSTLRAQPHLEAIFWDYSSLFQHPPGGRRTADESAAFGMALDVMGDLYASAIGTTVLQIKEIPPRPSDFDGAICLFNIVEGTSEADIRAALRRFGTISSCQLSTPAVGVVRFSTHEAAVAATANPAILSHLCAGVATLYNARSYDGRRGDSEHEDDNGRGWCCFESSVSSEVTSRLTVYPKLRAELEKLPPKMLLLSSDSEASAERQSITYGGEELGARVQQIVSAIENATFTGAGDKPKVVGMYKEYVSRIAGVLQSTLALAATSSAMQELPTEPDILPPASSQPLSFANGQLLLVLSERDARRGGSEGDAEVGAVEASSIKISIGGACPVVFDDISHVVLPWAPPTDGWDEPLLRDIAALPALADQLRALSKQVEELISTSSIGAKLPSDIMELVKILVAAAHDLSTLSISEGFKRVALRELQAALPSKLGNLEREQLQKLLSERGLRDDSTDDARRAALEKWRVADLDDTLESLQLGELRQILSDTLASLGPLAVAALRASSRVGARRYAAGQHLTVRHAGKWADVEVDAAELVHVDGTLVPLHPWNHAPRSLPQEDFETLRMWWEQVLLRQHSHITDALTGRRLDVLQQCVAITVEGERGADITDAQSLSSWLRSLHAERCEGGATDVLAAALLTGPPAAGKTSLLSQVVVHSLGNELVPVLIKVQRLQERMLSDAESFATAWNWVDAFLRLEQSQSTGASQSTWRASYIMLRQALVSRRVLVLLDGLDEAGALRERIERHVAEVLAPQGHVVLATSRPAGIDSARFALFRRLELAPLSAAQQRLALEQRLGARAGKLLEYVETSVPRDTETGRRVTANPLMLSMVASVFELRQGVGMPSTVAELYKHASDAMLARGGIVGDDLRRLLQAVFFQTHIATQRVITTQYLLEAAESIGCAPEALEELRGRVMTDRMPLLSLLQTQPLQMQSSHLSFQEYFAARQLCEEGTCLSGDPPWKWPAFWANTVDLGAEIGEPFARGVLRAFGLGNALDLSGRLGGDRPTSLRMVANLATCLVELDLSRTSLTAAEAQRLARALQINRVITNVNLLGNAMGSEGAALLRAVLLDHKTLKTLCGLRPGQTDVDFSNQSFGPTDCVLLAGDLEVNTALAKLDLSHNAIGDQGAIAIAEALKVQSSLVSLCLWGNEIGPAGAAAIANALGVNTTLSSLNFAYNRIDHAGATSIAEALAGTPAGLHEIGADEANGVLTTLNLQGNLIGDLGASAIARALEINGVLSTLNLSFCGIGARGAVALASALKVNESLTSLTFHDNNIGPVANSMIDTALSLRV